MNIKNVVASGMLVIAAAGAAYYLFVYEPQEQSATAKAPPPVVTKRQLAPAMPAAKPASAQPTKPASSVPTTAPAPSTAQLPAIASAPRAVMPAPEKVAGPVTPIIPVQELESKKRQAAPKPERLAKPAEMDKTDIKLDTPGMSQQVAPQAQDVPSPPTPSAAEPAPVEPAPERSGITPKYNDIMTAVLRSDLEAAKQLLDLGWWADKPGESGITPLMAAVMNRDTRMVQLLLDYGAEPTLQVLRLARRNKDDATASLLEQKGAR